MGSIPQTNATFGEFEIVRTTCIIRWTISALELDG